MTPNRRAASSRVGITAPFGGRVRQGSQSEQSEHVIQTDIRLAAADYPELVLWRNHTGVTQGEERVRRYGLAVGSSDLVGILTVKAERLCVEPGDPLVCLGHEETVGRFIALEIKSATGRTTHEQDLFLALVRRHGGFACVCRSVDEFHRAIARARAGASE